MTSDDAYNALILSGLKGVGPSTIEKVLGLSSYPLKTALELCEYAYELRKNSLTVEQFDEARKYADFQVDMASKNDTRVISLLDAEFPKTLMASGVRLAVLYVKGNVGALNIPSVAVIGTREPTPHGEEITKRITDWMVQQGWAIVSGLALGCDSIAHKQAIESGGKTIAVMAHGLQTISPSRNKDLATSILSSDGALVSEFGFDIKPAPTNFVIRDKTQSALSRGVIMIQSDLVGGSLHASRAAIKDLRPLIVPFPTYKDIAHSESKISANLLLASDDAIGKCNLLKCASAGLENLHIIRRKEEYGRMLEILSKDLSQ
ncbi:MULTISPECIES: DNA-processing protein DprA [unclassified Pseudomonas]|uniref:DNA-processing protein DprA n=1 Tax=unclassified Pseudomonas TaxID=196821 RepID=UPI0008714261|nr:MULTISPECIES: DNA-processing protein DprA [unclassified Pseudomonas]SCW99545.1 DNA processing protein [Pseudomonas sp. NFACC56-3]SFL06825.1 DNA processing protein [Pseudomonas sp. NFACC52]